MTDLSHSLERRVVICARRDTVFRYFTDSERFASWWGAGSSIDARPGGAVQIVYPNGVRVTGEVVELVDGERIAFTYGYEDADKPIPPGGSTVHIALTDVAEGTALELRHEFGDSATRDAHRPGWRYQLAVFATTVAAEQHRGLAGSADAYFAAWELADVAACRAALAEVAVDDVQFRDGFACVAGLAELAEHIAAVRAHMPPATMRRQGEPRQCQGTAIVDWVAVDADGDEVARGSNVFGLAPDGRIATATGLWSAG